MTSRPPIRDLAKDAIERAWASAIASGSLPPIPDDMPPPAVEVERPASEEHGDLATNLALKLARPYRMAPLTIATALVAELMAQADTDPGSTPIAGAFVAPPGFVNLRLADFALERVIGDVLAAPESWGRSATPGEPRTVNVEFVSANPTGPLHVGNARGAFVGDLLCRVLEAGGQRVTREYYFNDSGGQIGILGASVAALRRGEPLPDDGYKGDYVADLAADLPDDVLASATAPGADTAIHRRPLGRRTSPGRHRAEPGRPRRHFRRLDERGPAARRGLGRSRGRAPAGERPRL